ncbi:6223_t:CDS:2, partial [Rhizophagus irregularis]
LNLYLDWADSRISETCEKALIRLIKGIDLGVVDDSEAIVMSMGKESSINIVGSCETCAPSSEVVAGFSVTLYEPGRVGVSSNFLLAAFKAKRHLFFLRALYSGDSGGLLELSGKIGLKPKSYPLKVVAGVESILELRFHFSEIGS